MRVIFLGSPEFALPALRRLIDSEHEIVGVFTQPDRPAGRGRKLLPPPVKLLASEHALPVFQPESVSAPDIVELMRTLAPDVGVIAAYGQILRQRVLDVPPHGILNIHASLLPRWRGAAPIPAAILAGDAETGATIMKVVRELDAGPMLASVRIAIGHDDTTATLTPRIAERGADLLLDVLPRYADGEIAPQPQDDERATYAPQIKKTDAMIDWERESAEHIARKVRAYNPWPVAFSYLDGEPLRIVEAFPIATGADPRRPPPGTIARAEQHHGSAVEAELAIATIDGWLAVRALQPPGRRALSAAEYLRGHAQVIGKRLTS
jgi:methionyl-tRNA formyltransferase